MTGTDKEHERLIAAKMLIDRYGAGALAHAALHVTELSGIGDEHSAEQWKAMVALLKTMTDDGAKPR